MTWYGNVRGHGWLSRLVCYWLIVSFLLCGAVVWTDESESLSQQLSRLRTRLIEQLNYGEQLLKLLNEQGLQVETLKRLLAEHEQSLIDSELQILALEKQLDSSQTSAARLEAELSKLRNLHEDLQLQFEQLSMKWNEYKLKSERIISGYQRQLKWSQLGWGIAAIIGGLIGVLIGKAL